MQSHYRDILAFVVRRVKSREDAEDLTQEIFAAAYAKADQLSESAKRRAWLYKIARNRIIDYYRHHGRLPELVEADDSLALPPQASAVADSDVAHCLNAILNFMPQKYSRAVRLADIEEATMAEISDQLRLSVAGAKSRVQRGRAMLAELLNECLDLEADAYGDISASCHKAHDYRFCAAVRVE